jgi:hypothetical protein
VDVAEGRNKDRGERGRGRGGMMIVVHIICQFFIIICCCYLTEFVTKVHSDEYFPCNASSNHS